MRRYGKNFTFYSIWPSLGLDYLLWLDDLDDSLWDEYPELRFHYSEARVVIDGFPLRETTLIEIDGDGHMNFFPWKEVPTVNIPLSFIPWIERTAEEEKEVAYAAFQEGKLYSSREIAYMTGIPLGPLGWRLGKALKSLLQEGLIEEHYQEEGKPFLYSKKIVEVLSWVEETEEGLF